jgi:glucokinase
VLGQLRNILQAIDAGQGWQGRDLAGIGIGCPGLVDSRRGIVRVPPNFPGWEEVFLADAVQDMSGLRTMVDNDVNAMAAGELCFGAGRGFQEMICLTLGTGVGGAFIAGGKIYTGFQGTAGEIGHMTVVPDGPLCKCGNRGCLERLIGAGAIVENALAKMEQGGSSSLSSRPSADLTPRHIAEAAGHGDRLAREVLRETGEYLGIVLAGLVNFLNPQAIIIGGGIAQAGELIFASARETIRSRAYALPGEAVRILPAQLGETAGLVGAATLLFMAQE